MPRALRLAKDSFAALPVVDQRVSIELDEAAVWRGARHWYTLQLAAFMAGALAGNGLATWLTWPADLLTLLGAACGTFAAWIFSKRREPQFSIRIVEQGDAGLSK